MNILLNRLPKDVVNIIGEYIPIQTRIWLSKTEYKKYRCSVGGINLFGGNLRKVIRNDFNFVLQIRLNQYYKKWKKKNTVYYKSFTIPSYIEYLNLLCIEYDSQKCRKLIKEKVSKKNKYRKIRIRNSRIWSN